MTAAVDDNTTDRQMIILLPTAQTTSAQILNATGGKKCISGIKQAIGFMH